MCVTGIFVVSCCRAGRGQRSPSPSIARAPTYTRTHSTFRSSFAPTLFPPSSPGFLFPLLLDPSSPCPLPLRRAALPPTPRPTLPHASQKQSLDQDPKSWEFEINTRVPPMPEPRPTSRAFAPLRVSVKVRTEV
jgi:hypothetical protein